ncbi:thioredoxin reductase [Streptomyces albus]|uniref:Thioredoxin reductase n=1 Tax=Streptomyces albus (strain ATCC 21838 / DSM 41398 / FERM P-419 / JCM 4703 / NBRC 107858) TaxID=1081613 RepID=A0A0B5EJF3_STRA4|nr:thioredoxin reductase [Streptomyces albus]AOU75944.1 thioredoxin reductase [Streptomyces albus]AYN31749.1 thioredoxin reductase [Streptomyces albus]
MLGGVVPRDVFTGATRDLVVTGPFFDICRDPRTELFKSQLNLDGEGSITVASPTTRTSLSGVFDAGDVVDRTYRQAITAAGTGPAAAPWTPSATSQPAARPKPSRQPLPSRPERHSQAGPSGSSGRPLKLGNWSGDILARVQSSQAKDHVREFNDTQAHGRREPAVRESIPREGLGVSQLDGPLSAIAGGAEWDDVVGGRPVLAVGTPEDEDGYCEGHPLRSMPGGGLSSPGVLEGFLQADDLYAKPHFDFRRLMIVVDIDNSAMNCSEISSCFRSKVLGRFAP